MTEGSLILFFLISLAKYRVSIIHPPIGTVKQFISLIELAASYE